MHRDALAYLAASLASASARVPRLDLLDHYIKHVYCVVRESMHDWGGSSAMAIERQRTQSVRTKTNNNNKKKKNNNNNTNNKKNKKNKKNNNT